jgi:membrane-associated protein
VASPIGPAALAGDAGTVTTTAAVLTDLTALAGWTYLVVALLVVADAVFPLIPAELAVVSGSVLAAAGRLSLPLLVGATAAGAVGGDCLGYLLGRGAGRLGVGRLLRHPRGRRALVWATRRLDRRAVPVLVVGRFVPGGRTASTVAAGFLRVHPPVFLLAATLGGTLWATFTGALGYLAGRAAADRPWVGVLAAAAVLLLAGFGAELLRRRRVRRAASRIQPVGVALGSGRSGPAPVGAPVPGATATVAVAPRSRGGAAASSLSGSRPGVMMLNRRIRNRNSR